MTRSSPDGAERLFAGQIGAEYNMLDVICPAAAQMSRRVGAFVASLPAAADRPLRVFEIGCGAGATTLAMLRERPDLAITAIDNEPAMLRQAAVALSTQIKSGQVRLVETDALAGLEALSPGQADVVASAYAMHNFLDPYRRKVLDAAYRALRPGGAFVNGDRYGLDDAGEHTRLTQEEVRSYFKAFGAINRYDLLEEWVVHLFSDESPEHIMRLAPALKMMKEVGFESVEAPFREGVNTLLTAAKPSA